MIHLIMSNVSFLTFPIDGGRRHGRHRRAHVLLPLRPRGRPSQPARLIDFLPAAINNDAVRARARAQGTRAALLLLLIAAPGWRSDYWDTSPSVCRLMRPARVHRMWGRKRSTREGRREGLWVELSNGPSEGKGLNIDCIIYMFYLTTGSACLRRNMLGPSHPGPARRSHAILKRLGVKEQYNVT